MAFDNIYSLQQDTSYYIYSANFDNVFSGWTAIAPTTLNSYNSIGHIQYKHVADAPKLPGTVQQFGKLIVGDKYFYNISNNPVFHNNNSDNYLIITDTDDGLFFMLTTDGRILCYSSNNIYSIKMEFTTDKNGTYPFLTFGAVNDPGPAHYWIITTMIYPPGLKSIYSASWPSLWNLNLPKKPGGLTAQEIRDLNLFDCPYNTEVDSDWGIYDDGGHYSGIGSCQYAFSGGKRGRGYTWCSLSPGGCDDGYGLSTTEMDIAHTCTHKWCAYNGWSNGDLEKCAVGDPDVININNGKMNWFRCRLTNSQAYVQGHLVGGDYHDFAWAPWGNATYRTQAVQEYCSQTDTTLEGGVPFFITDPRCTQWCVDNPDLCDKAKDSYCISVPSTSYCGKFCVDSTKQCGQSMVNFCTQENLKTQSCQDYCSDNSTTCDSAIQAYCGRPDISLASKISGDNAEICGCFMGTTFYSDFRDELHDKIIITDPNNINAKTFNLNTNDSGFPAFPYCYYPPCAGSLIKPSYVKQRTTDSLCPNVQQCIQKFTLNNQGHINGNININQDVNCSFMEDKPQVCATSQILDPQTNQCTLCQEGTIPNAQQNACVAVPTCNPGQILQNNICVQCSNNTIADGAQCSDCPDNTVASSDHTTCDQCAGNTIFDNEQCLDCPDNTTASSDHTSCIKQSTIKLLLAKINPKISLVFMIINIPLILYGIYINNKLLYIPCIILFIISTIVAIASYRSRK